MLLVISWRSPAGLVVVVFVMVVVVLYHFLEIYAGMLGCMCACLYVSMCFCFYVHMLCVRMYSMYVCRYVGM